MAKRNIVDAGIIVLDDYRAWDTYEVNIRDVVNHENDKRYANQDVVVENGELNFIKTADQKHHGQ